MSESYVLPQYLRFQIFWFQCKLFNTIKTKSSRPYKNILYHPVRYMLLWITVVLGSELLTVQYSWYKVCLCMYAYMIHDSMCVFECHIISLKTFCSFCDIPQTTILACVIILWWIFYTVPALFSLFCVSVSSVFESSVLGLALFCVGVLLLPLVLKECLFSLGEYPKNKPLIAFTPTPHNSLQHRGRATLISSKHASFLLLLSAATGAEIWIPEITIMQITHNYRLFPPYVSSIASRPLARHMQICYESTQKPE